MVSVPPSVVGLITKAMIMEISQTNNWTSQWKDLYTVGAC